MNSTSEFGIKADFGTSLNSYSGLEVIEANGASELAGFLKQIKFPFNIVQIVVQGSRFYAFVNASRPIKKKKEK